MMLKNTLVPWTGRVPRELVDFGRGMDEMMDRLFGTDTEAIGTDTESSWPPAFAPNLNVAETDSGYEISVELAGLTPKDFSVEYRDGHLWITGERKGESEETGKAFHRVERSYGKFRRVIRLADVDSDAICADYKYGMLLITAPKSESLKPKKIEVKG